MRRAAVFALSLLDFGGAAAQTAPGGGNPTGAPTTSGTSSTIGTTAASVLPAEPALVTRIHMKIWNFAAPGGANLYCTDDGTTPSSSSASFIVYAQGGYERDAPAWVPSGVIQCVSTTGPTPYKAEAYP